MDGKGTEVVGGAVLVAGRNVANSAAFRMAFYAPRVALAGITRELSGRRRWSAVVREVSPAGAGETLNCSNTAGD